MLRKFSGSRRAPAVAIFCILLILFPGCRQSRLVRSASPNARNAYRPAPPGSLSSYIRAVLKISAEKGPEVEQRVKKAREQDPDLARQAEDLSTHPTDIDAGLKVAESYTKAGLYYPAYEVYQRLRAASEPRVEIELGLAGIWDKWQDYSLAQTHAEYAVQINAQSDAAWNLLGRIQLHRDDYKAAAASFENALRFQRSDAVLYANTGYAYLRLGRLEQAQEYLEKALGLDGTIAEAHNHLGIVLARKGQYDLALTHFEQTSEPVVALNNLGAVCLEQGRSEDGRRFLREALSLKPDYANAAAQLREAEAPTPAPAPASAAANVHVSTQAPVIEPRVIERSPPPSHVTVSIAPARVATVPAPAAAVGLDMPEAPIAEMTVPGNVVLGKGPYLIEKADPAPVRPVLSENRVYQPAVPARLRALAERVAAPLPPPPAPGRHPRPTASAPSRSGAKLSVTALRWQEPLFNRHFPAQTSLDWSASPHSRQSSLFYAPSIPDILLAGFMAIGVFLGLLLAGGAGASVGIVAACVAVLGQLV